MLKRLPVIPTLLVLVAVAVMVRLGFWQLDRMGQKAALIAQYDQAQDRIDAPAWPQTKDEAVAVLYRQTILDCRKPGPDMPIAGHNAQGETGWSHMVTCQLEGGGTAEIVIGWSRNPASQQWTGGVVSGTIVEGIAAPARLVVWEPAPGLEPNAAPDPATIPNNHWSYAIQWFLFAATALVIYALALRKRLRGA